MPKFEYAEVNQHQSQLTYFRDGSRVKFRDKEHAAVIAKLGQEGWEMSGGSYPILYFKREIA
jgi:hypothetical protein